VTTVQGDKYAMYIVSFIAKGYIQKSKLLFLTLLQFILETQLSESEKDLRLVIDYRALNAILIKERFPLPVPEELIDHLQSKRFISKMDFYSRYY
jgi:hypothetical protein